MQDVVLRPYRPQDGLWIVDRHQTLYAADEGFDHTFGPLVAAILRHFDDTHDPARERGWVADRAGDRLGCIFCVDAGDGVAKLRLFLVDPGARGTGLGRTLLAACTDFARDAGYSAMTLWTHESHKAACALYRAAGWTCTGATPVRSFGVDLVEQVWEIDL